MRIRHEPIKARQRVNVLVDSDTIAEARQLGIKLSRTVERALAIEVSLTRQQRCDANQDAIAHWTAWYETQGDPLARLDPL